MVICMSSVQSFHHVGILRLHSRDKKRSSNYKSTLSSTYHHQVLTYIRCDHQSGEEEDEDGGKRKKKHKILIAGGGIGGLVYALAAKRSGFDVTVFEKDLTAARGEGRERGPIQLSSNGLNLLQSIDKDVASQIMDAGYALSHGKRYGVVDGTTGEWLAETDFITPAVRNGLPVGRIICRMELQTILLNAVGEDIVLNKSKVVDFVSDAKKVTVFLENGEQHQGDILVGADGIRSVVRSKLFGPKEPKFSGFVCYTGIQECHSEYLSSFGSKIFLGFNKSFLAVYIGKGRIQWYALVKDSISQSPLSSRGYKNMLLGRYGDSCDEVITMLSKTEEETIIHRPIYDIDPMNTWGKGRVVLLGDAAHAMLPNLGQGGSMAIEDCYWLMLELQNLAHRHTIPLDEITAAFRRFESRRMFRVVSLHTICRIAATMITSYETHLEMVGPLQLLFDLSGLRVKNPAHLISGNLMKLSLPTFIDWMVASQ